MLPSSAWALLAVGLIPSTTRAQGPPFKPGLRRRWALRGGERVGFHSLQRRFCPKGCGSVTLTTGSRPSLGLPECQGQSCVEGSAMCPGPQREAGHSHAAL